METKERVVGEEEDELTETKVMVPRTSFFTSEGEEGEIEWE